MLFFLPSFDSFFVKKIKKSKKVKKGIDKESVMLYDIIRFETNYEKRSILRVC